MDSVQYNTEHSGISDDTDGEPVKLEYFVLIHQWINGSIIAQRL